ncbi:hypothetical protein UCD39_10910 [Nitrospirillum sp. BR 11752]|uniref:hypothetical protein n=1 Tax=Nitrospirillum sp. BR 11752 TaxID=3104293 RepID=UPI002EC3C965|nr:hypothetical protein [Nitrospirillum sp. BR 11752]
MMHDARSIPALRRQTHGKAPLISMGAVAPVPDDDALAKTLVSAPVSPGWVLFLYYAVQFGKTMLWVAADLIAFYVLATVQHLPPQDIALVLMGGLGWHALSDLAVGLWLQRPRTIARDVAAIAGLAVPIACAAFVTALMVAAAKPWAALGAMMVSRSAYALFDVPHHALVGRMARRGWPAVRIVGLRNLWGQLASLALGLCLVPALGPAMTRPGLLIVLVVIALVAGMSSLPIFILVRRLWDMPEAAAASGLDTTNGRSGGGLTAVLALHLCATLLVATTSKIALAAITPGMALAALSAGRIVASIPLPTPWRERNVGTKLCGAALFLIASVIALISLPGPITAFGFGWTSGWINILTWAWLGRATNHPRAFGLAVMLSKIGLLASIFAACRLSP